jgi:hypothetical protein
VSNRRAGALGTDKERSPAVRRRSLVVAAFVAASLVPVPASAEVPRPGADASVNQLAYATSIVHKDGRDYMYVAGASRSVQSNGRTRTTAFAKKARCLTMKTKRIKLIACAAFIFPQRVPDKAFEFDPLLDSAALRFRNKDGATAMTWKGRGTPEPGFGPYADPDYGAGVYGELYRGARAGGKILDEPYPARRFGFALLMEGVDAEGFTSRNVTIRPTKSGALKVEALYRIPR